MAFASTNQKALSADVFDFLAKHHLKHINENRIAAARAMMVDGETNSAVATRFKISRQIVSQNVSLVWKAYEFDQELAKARGQIDTPIRISQDPAPKNAVIPAGWKQVTILAPIDLVNEFTNQVKSKLEAI